MCFKHTHIDINLIHTTQSHLTKIIQLLNFFLHYSCSILEMFFCKECPSNLLIFTCMSHSVFDEGEYY